MHYNVYLGLHAHIAHAVTTHLCPPWVGVVPPEPGFLPSKLAK